MGLTSAQAKGRIKNIASKKWCRSKSSYENLYDGEIFGESITFSL